MMEGSVVVRRIKTIAGEHPCLVIFPPNSRRETPRISLWMDKLWLIARQREIMLDPSILVEEW